MRLQLTMNVVARIKLYFTRLLAQLSDTQHGEISKTILCVTIVVYLICQIVVTLNRDQCSGKVLTDLSRANDRLQRVESSLESLEKTVVILLREGERSRLMAESVARSSHGRARRQASRTYRSEIRYLKRKIKALESSFQCAYSVNGTDDKGRPCGKIRFGKGRKNLKNTKDPNQQASGRKDQTDSNNQSDQRKKPSTPQRKTSRRSAVFTRWGTTQCSTSSKSHTSLVYSGRVAAAHYKNKGGGSNYLCLPDRAFYTNPVNITESESSHLYPVKYGEVMNTFSKCLPGFLETLSPEICKKVTPPLNFKDVPCAVCRVDGATAVLMVPARNICPRRWNRQYHGYLMSQNHDFEKSEYVCVDVEARGIPNTRNPNGEAFLHLTEFKCGSSCSGYEQHKALTCIVCTT